MTIPKILAAAVALMLIAIALLASPEPLQGETQAVAGHKLQARL